MAKIDNHTKVKVNNFSGNYTSLLPDEIQSLHWTQDNATVYPVVVLQWIYAWKSYIFHTDDKKHDVHFVESCNIKVVMEYQLRIKVEQNDGYSWWFKCVWAFAALAHCDKKTMRNFCETSHIKPKYDSLDGVVKCHTAGFSLLGVEASPSQLA